MPTQMETMESQSAVLLAPLRAKLVPPHPSGPQVLRQSVIDQVCAPQGAKLVLMRAPAGFGKTTAMLQCQSRAQAMAIATGWLTLDRSDNDASRFLAGLAHSVTAIIGEDPSGPGLNGRCRTTGDLALQLISCLSRLDDPFAIFLDDFETVREASVLGWLRELVDRLPPQARLVVASRSLPDLRLGRLRARGQLLEIDATRLRFSLEETAAFFGSPPRGPLSFEDLSKLHAKTEGWVAALWLASRALEHSKSPSEFIERFSGTEQAVADYLAEDVLERQPPSIRAFLLRTSVLRHLEAPLCDALMPGVDSRQVLKRLQSADVLLVPLGHEASTFRYHSLFAHFLQAQLRRELPQELTQLHAEASRWYEAQGRPVPAIDHALEGRDIEHAVRLLSQHAPRLLAQGRMRLLSRWFSVVPSSALGDHPELQLIHIWSVCFTRGPWEAMDLLSRSGLIGSNDVRTVPHVRALQPCLLAMMDRYEEAYAAGIASLDQGASAVPFADSVYANAMATIAAVIGRSDQARRLVDAARRGQGSGASEFNMMYSETAEGMIDLQEARLRQATARFRMAVTANRTGDYSHTEGNAWAGVPYALSVYEGNELDQSAHLLHVYLPVACDVRLPDHVILGYITLSRIAFLRGDVDHALQLLTELEYVGHKGRLPRVAAGAKLERARLQLLQGHYGAASEELDRTADAGLWKRVDSLRFLANDLEYLDLARLRWELHAGDPRTAAISLASAAQGAEEASRFRRALKLRVLQAAALQRAGDPTAAAVVAGALKVLCGQGFVRLVLDEGEIVGPVLHSLNASLQSSPALHDDPVFVDYVQHLASICPASGKSTATSEATGAAILLDPLTRKEIRVLQLLAEGYSNGAMAEKLFVSDSTVRTHLRNINTKLNAHSRTQAVAAARRLGVIP